MKRLLVLILVLLTLGTFVSCQEKAPSLTTQLGCFTYPGTDWGMTADEFFAALNTDSENFTETNEDNVRIDTKATSYLSKEPFQFWNRKVDMKADFSSVPFLEKETLRKVVVRFQEPFTPEEYSELCTYLEQLLQEQGSKVVFGDSLSAEYLLRVASEATTEHLPEEMKLKISGYFAYQREKMGMSYDEEGTFYFDMFSPSVLTQLTALFMEDTQTAVVMFEGGSLAHMVGCAEAYDVLVK